MRSLGNILDLCVGINPVADIAAGANTGKRVHMRNYETLGVFFFKNAASAGTDSIILTLQEHSVNTGGSPQSLAAITKFYTKSAAAALAGTEAWVESTQAAGATLTLANTGVVPAANQAMVYFDIEAASMSAGFEWLSINIADPGAGGTILGGVFYVPTRLKVSRRPDLLPQPNA